ncbi:MarR family winged helix-turn-helix transcriptional regulator [Jannaschia sp. R86511]|uniref:MarR family winged helix-turn-helix transcriptional regulator n=1 Tax=Jannaschia sp. R86511 TaxID=3093853 RepID=UPI0036D22015
MASVRAMADALARFDDAACEAFGIGRTDLRALNLMEHGPVTAGHIASELRLTSGTVTVLIDRLVKHGYASRHADPDDRRKVMVGLEPATYAAFARVYAPCGQAVMAATAQLSDRQRSAAQRALSLITTAVVEQENNLRGADSRLRTPH